MNSVKTFSDLIGASGIFNDGDWIESKDQDKNGDIRLIQLADIGVDKFIDKSSRFMTSDKAKELKCTYLKAGDILIARMPDPIGRACIFPGIKMQCVTVVDICIVRVDPEIVNSHWLVHFINSSNFQRQISNWITGTTRQRISRGNLSKIEIPLPPIKEQKCIAAILDKADAICRKRQQAIDITDQLLRSVFLDMFGDSNDSWESVPFLKVAKTGKNTFVNGPFGSNLLTSELHKTGVPVLYIQDVRNGRFQKKSNRHVTDLKAEQLSSCNVFSGDVLVAKVGDPPGAAAVYPEGEPDAIVTQDVVRIRPSLNRTTPEFIAAFFNSRLGEKWLAPIIVEATRSRFGLGELKKREFLLPPLELQKKYSEIHKMMTADRNRLIEGKEKVNALFNSLTQQAFNGQLS